ncbi:hypothetical protein N0V93_000650 [Gnomoniopsis smithogilvyi]|uniref:Methyltransferase type 11 domain-containing protein n=1 Tax=Gnomoniopsis smithogilvyi TaxID=1191159 RepID=A0A9W8Z043_9PEZI|nr:hypothetical protein N0V93_000650 [Gnomoniopsis smithogilvyi]
MPTLSHLREIFLFLIDPWLFMLLSLSYLPRTIFNLILTFNFPVLLSPTRLQAAWFGRFWAHAGPGVRETGEVRVIPLLEGRVRDGRVLSSPPPPPSSGSNDGNGVCGVVLEVGPGTGLWASVFAHPSLAQGISRIYGVEPNAAHHAELRQRIAAAKLGEKYEVVPCGIEDLAATGRVEKGSVDCVMSVMCLCSIPEPEKHVKELFGYLKKGGRWFVYEHVRCESEKLRECGLGMRLYQAFVNLFWPHVLGGCELCRNTPKTLVEAGPWSKIDLAQPEGEPWYHPLPHILGTLTK